MGLPTELFGTQQLVEWSGQSGSFLVSNSYSFYNAKRLTDKCVISCIAVYHITFYVHGVFPPRLSQWLVYCADFCSREEVQLPDVMYKINITSNDDFADNQIIQYRIFSDGGLTNTW